MTRIAVFILTFFCSISSFANGSLRNELALAEAWLEAQRAYDRIPGLSAAIVRDQDVLWSGGFGVADLESEAPAEADTIYGICSISKLFTAIAVMQLRDQGKFQLHDPVSGMLPWFDLEQSFDGSPEITLYGLLTHSAGLPREADSPYWVGPDFEFPTREEIRRKLSGQDTLYPAARYFQYSNLGLTLAGEIVVEQSGQSFDEYIGEHILDPLQMSDTATGFPTDDREPRVATGYGYSGRDGERPIMPRYDAKGITPAAGFSSTALDLARFASWQLAVLSDSSDKVLSGNTLREMHRIQWMDQDWSIARGLGFGIYRDDPRTLVGHGGDCPGFNTRLFIDPPSEVAVVVMANRNNSNVYGYGTVLYDILEAGGTPRSKPDSKWADYLGNYDGRPWGGEELVFEWDGGLAMLTVPNMEPVNNLVPLKHIEGDRFHIVRNDESRGHEVRFERDESGKVVRVAFHGIWLPKMNIGE